MGTVRRREGGVTTTRTLEIAALPGDGIGREVMAACLALLERVEAACGGPTLRLTAYDAGAQFHA
jgi:3-isopropylmalate dehydrogenase